MALCALLIVASTLVAIPLEVGADHGGDHPPLECSGTGILMQTGKLWEVVPDPANPGQYTFELIGGDGIGNSLGFDPITNYLYGIKRIGGINHVEIYDANGAVVSSVPVTAPMTNGSSYSGTVLGDGTYVVATWNQAYNGSNRNLWTVDPITGATTWIANLPRTHADFSFNPLDGFLYHVTSGVLYKINPLTGAETTVPVTVGLSNGYGSSWFDSAGNLFLYKNSDGALIQVTDIASGSADWELVGDGPKVSGADGASCVGGWEFTKDVAEPDRVFRPGEVVTYELTVFNNALPTVDVPVEVCDTLPAVGWTYVGNFSDTTGAGSLSSGGTAGSTSFCYEFDSLSSLWTDPATPGSPPVTVSFDVQLPDDMAPDSYENQATLEVPSGATSVMFLSDDPDDLAEDDDPTPIEVTGQATVAKKVIGHPDDPPGDSFPMVISCSVAGSPIDVDATSIVASGTTTPWPGAATNGFSIEHGDRVDLLDLPADAVCTIIEDPAPLASYSVSVSSSDALLVENGGQLVIDERPGEEVLSFTNATSEFIIEKTSNVAATAHPIDPAGSFTFFVECDNGYSDTFVVATTAGSATVASGGLSYDDLPLLPHGTGCIISETDSGTFTLVSANDVTVKTSSKVEATASFTNDRQLADLTIEKQLPFLDGLGLDDEPFVVDVSCSGGFTVSPYVIPDVVISVNTPAVISSLPVGATCSVVEDADPRFTVSYEPAKVTIEPSGSSIAVINEAGPVEIEKATTVEASEHPIDPVATFDFEVACSNGLLQTVSITTTTTTASGAVASIGYDDLPLLPTGTTCTITEQTPPAGWAIASTNPVMLTIAPGKGDALASFTNVPLLKDLAISKVIIAPPGVDTSDDSFVVDISCAGPFVDSPLVIADQVLTVDAPVVIADLPATAVCTITEDADARYVTVAAPTVDLATVKGDPVGVAITNSRRVADLTVSKVVDPASLFADEAFTVDVSCTGDVSPDPLVFADQVVSSTTPLVIADLPTGAVCTVVEDADVRFASSSTPADGSVLIGDDGSSVTVTNTRVTDTLTVTKSFAGLPKGADFSTVPFDVTVSCTGDVEPSPLVFESTVAASTPLVIDNLPTGTVCSILEADDPRFTEINPEPATIAVGGTSAAIVNETTTIAITKSVVAPATVAATGTFGFDVECANGYSGSVEVEASTGSAGSIGYPDLPLLPVGTSCTITEQTPPSGWTGAPAVTVTSEAGSTATASFENARVTADLTISKVLLGVLAGEDFDDVAFPVSVTCTGDFPGGTFAVPGPLAVSVDTPLVIPDLPTGASCTIVESPDPRWAVAYGDPGGVVEIAEGGTSSILTNATGAFIIEKNTTVSGAHPIDPTGSFTFEIVCDNTPAYIATHVIDVAATSSTTGLGALSYGDLPLLPNGTTCLITETALPAGWSLVSPGSVELVVDAGEPATAAFTNERDLAALSVVKTLAGAPAGFDESFVVDVTCTGPFTVSPYVIEDLSLAAGTPLVIEDLPVGARCSVVEDADDRFTTTYSPTGPVEIVDGGADVGITNATGTFSISKTVEAPDTHSVDAVGSFTFAATCDDGSSFEVTVDAGNLSSGSSVPADVPLLPAGTNCSVVETAVPGGFTASTTAQTLTIGTDGTPELRFANSRSAADLTITKSIVGTDDLDSEPFVVSMSCTGDFDGGPLVLTDLVVSVDTPLVISDLPTGSICTVAESSDPRFTVSYSPTGGVATIVDGGSSVDITNTTGTFSIDKVISAPDGVEAEGTFTFDVACTNGLDTTYTVDASTGAIGSILRPTIPLIAAGATCTVTETLTPEGWTLVSANPQSVTIDPTVEPTLRFVNARDEGAITITKTLDGVRDGVDLSAVEFVVDVTCTGDLPGGSVAWTGLALSAAASLLIDELPTGAECSVAEVSIPDGWALTSPSPVDVTIVGGEPLAVDFVNTRTTADLTVSKTILGAPADAALDEELFIVTIACSGDFPTGSIVFTNRVVSVSESLIIEDLPTGSTCTVVESADARFATTYEPTPSSVEIAADGAEVDITNTTATMSIQKTVSAPSIVEAGATFTFELTCSNGYADTVTVDASTAGGGSVGFPDLPLIAAGSTCSVLEVEVPAGWAAPVANPLEFVLPNDGTVPVAAFVNDRQVTDLTISKVVEGAPDDPDVDYDAVSFAVEVTCQGDFPDGEYVVPGPLFVSAGTPLTIGDLPTGSVCTIVETPDPRFASSFGPLGGTVVLTLEGNEVTLTNSTGQLTITKSAEVTDLELISARETFTFGVECSNGFADIVQVETTEDTAAGATGSIGYDQLPLLPAGTSCTVTELDVPAGWTPLDGPIVLEIDPGMPALAPFTNVRDVADLTIQKSLVGVLDGVDLGDEPFGFTVTCTGDFVNGAVEYQVDATANTPAVIPGLPTGSACAVVEDPDPRFLTVWDDGDIWMVADDGVTVDVANERLTADLLITKAIEGVEPAGVLDTEAFDVTVTCTGEFPGGVAVYAGLPVSVSQPVVISDLPTQAVCSVVETADPRFSTTYEPLDPSGVSGLATISLDGAAVEITNRAASFTISKSLEVPFDGFETTVTVGFSVSCSNGYVGVHELLVSTGESASLGYPALPLVSPGTTCAVEETGVPVGWTPVDPGPVTVEISGDAAAEAVFVNQRETGSITLSKSFVGVPDALDLDDEQFTVDVSCTADDLAEPYVLRDLPISVNEPLTIEPLPAGASCQINEDPDLRFTAATPLDDDIVLVVPGPNPIELVNSTTAMTITKRALLPDGSVLDPNHTVTIDVSCDNGYDGAHEISADVTTPFGAEGSAQDASLLFPEGTRCELTERPVAGWENAGEATSTVIVDGEPLDVVISNQRQTADLVITKQLVAFPDALDLGGMGFEVSVSCSGGFIEETVVLPGPLVVAADQPITISGLPVGATCSIEELPVGEDHPAAELAFAVFVVDSDAAADDREDGSVTIAADGNTFELTNTANTPLPFTGAPRVGLLLWIATVLLAGGGILDIESRRRRAIEAV